MESRNFEKITTEELKERKADLEKFLKIKDFRNVLNILKVLQKVAITSELLRETLIGKSITTCSNLHVPNEQGDAEIEIQIKEMSSSLLTKWKKINKAEKAAGAKEVPKFPEEELKVNKKESDQGNELSTTVSTCTKWAEGFIFIPESLQSSIQVENKLRKNTQEQLIKILQTPLCPEYETVPDVYEDSVLTDACSIAIDVEKELYTRYKDQREYKDKIRSILFNLKDKRNTILRVKVLEGSLTPQFLATADSIELACEQKKKQREELQNSHINARRSDFQYEQLKQKNTGTGFFTCKKCKSKKTTYYQQQTRGADEPMTNFISCLDCGNQWKC